MRRAVTICAGLVAASTALQRAGESRDRTRYPPPGRMVDVGGRRLHVIERGVASPTVVVETGAGSLALGWDEVAESSLRRSAW